MKEMVLIRFYKLMHYADDNNWYIGSTRKTLKQRLKDHKRSYDLRIDERKLFLFIDQYDTDGLYMTLLDEFECLDEFDKFNQFINEQRFMDLNCKKEESLPSLNNRRAYIDQKEYQKSYDDKNKEIKAKKWSERYHSNIEESRRKSREYEAKNKDRINSCRRDLYAKKKNII